MRHFGSAYMRDPGMLPGVRPEDALLLNHEVLSLVTLLNGTALLNRARTTFRTVQLFAVSALGHQPRGDKLGSRGIAPQRCLDPLKWALSRAGVVPVPGR